MDLMTTAQRSAHMRKIRSHNTAPELLVRRSLHALGYRFRLYGRGLPGEPDIIFKHKRKAIFVHGCFWHYHEHCPIAHVPKSRQAYWQLKFDTNKIRDQQNLLKLEDLGWTVLVIWECETAKMQDLLPKITKFLGPPRSTAAEQGKREDGSAPGCCH